MLGRRKWRVDLVHTRAKWSGQRISDAGPDFKIFFPAGISARAPGVMSKPVRRLSAKGRSHCLQILEFRYLLRQGSEIQPWTGNSVGQSDDVFCKNLTFFPQQSDRKWVQIP